MRQRSPAPDGTLASMARGLRASAAQAEALSLLQHKIPQYLERGRLVSVLATDTALLQYYDDPKNCKAWLTVALREWLRTNDQFNRDVGATVFYRYMVVALPSVLKNWAKQRALIELILLNVHLQMWHGVVCGVVFLNPEKVDVRQVVRDLNFTAIPSAGLIYDLPSFYQSERIDVTQKTGTHAKSHMAKAWQWLFQNGEQPIWLHYDEANFYGPKLSGWRWIQLRRFFMALYGHNTICIGCLKRVTDFSLDHIAPFSGRYFQTIINFRPLCGVCNSAKGTFQAEDPFNLRLLLHLICTHGTSRICIVSARRGWAESKGQLPNKRYLPFKNLSDLDPALTFVNGRVSTELSILRATSSEIIAP